MKKKIITNSKEKYCECCGHKNELVTSGVFDSKTGAPEYEYCCMNKECIYGDINISIHCNHIWKTTHFLFFPTGEKCLRCGAETGGGFDSAGI